MGSGAPWLFLLRNFELKALSMGSFGRGAAALLRAVEGLCIGLREPAALAPDCVWTVVRGLKVTVRCGRGAGVFLEVEALFGEECVGSRGEDSSTDVAMLTRRGIIRCTGREMLFSDGHAPREFRWCWAGTEVRVGLRLMLLALAMTPVWAASRQLPSSVHVQPASCICIRMCSAPPQGQVPALHCMNTCSPHSVDCKLLAGA